MKKKGFGGHCVADSSPASNFVGSTQLAGIFWISIAPLQSWMSNSTVFNVVCREESDGMKRAKKFWWSRALKPSGSGTISGKRIAMDVYWTYGRHCNGEPAAFGL